MRKLCLLFALSLVALGIVAQSRKSVSILGDSYSTFEGYIDPATNAMWYFQKCDTTRTDVDDVTQTWWHLLISENGLKLEKNNSYSGSTVCTTGYNNKDFTDRAFITRMDNLGSPDILLIFGATNDSWANAPIGDWVWENQTVEDLKSFRPALTKMLDHIKKRYPNTEILYIINDGLKPEITSSVTEACDRYGIPYIQLQGIDKKRGHPDRKGMRKIADQVATKLDLK